MSQNSPVIRVYLSATDPPRGVMGRRDLYLERDAFPDDVPWVSLSDGEEGQGGVPLPAIVGLRGVLRDLIHNTRGEVTSASWVVTPGPWVSGVMRKFADRRQREAMLLPLLKHLSAMKPEVGAWWEVHCGAAVCNNPLGANPFFEARFGSFNERKRRAQNARILARWWGLPTVVNFFRRVVGKEEWWPQGYATEDPWQEPQVREAITRLLLERAALYADHLWRAWLMDPFYVEQLENHGIIMGVKSPTQFVPGGMRTIFRGSGFDKRTVYFRGAGTEE